MRFSAFFLCFALVFPSACLFPAQAADNAASHPGQEQVIAAGSGVNLAITRLLAEAFGKQQPGIAIDIPASIGTKGAVKAAAEGAIQLGLISRPLKEDERALGLAEKPYARVAIVLAAHAGVPDDSITFQELNDIFRGAKNQWQNGKPIIVQAREKSDSGFQVLEENIPGFKEIYAESHEAKRWTLFFTDQEANAALASTPNTLGVTDLGMIATEHLPVRALRLNGIAPDAARVQDGSYPLSRRLSFIYKTGTLSPGVQAFLAFAASDAGRAILQANGYIPE